MLQLAYIRDNKEKVINGLGKRRFTKAAEIIDQVIELDDLRKSTQAKHDQVLAESNALSKQIGILMREGKKDEAEEAEEEDR